MISASTIIQIRAPNNNVQTLVWVSIAKSCLAVEVLGAHSRDPKSNQKHRVNCPGHLQARLRQNFNPHLSIPGARMRGTHTEIALPSTLYHPR